MEDTISASPETARRGGEASPRRARIDDVARRAGVSIKTVSRVVNREPNVSQATREAVMEAVAALSYRPNVFARRLASDRSFLIGLLYDNPSAGYVAGLQLGALERCRDEGYHLVVEVLDSQHPGIAEAMRSLIAESAPHGVILTPPLCDSGPALDALAQTGTRFVRVAPGKPAPGVPTVSIDDRKAAYDMTCYLIGLGHRRIGLIKGHPDHSATHARLEGYRDALSAAGIAYDEGLCGQGMFSFESSMGAAERLLKRAERPTAIFASNDDMAAAVLAVSQQLGIKVPSELSVAGFDDSLVAQVTWPRLTTCRQPIREMASVAVAMLVEAIGGDYAMERRLNHELVVRESTAPPPG